MSEKPQEQGDTPALEEVQPSVTSTNQDETNENNSDDDSELKDAKDGDTVVLIEDANAEDVALQHLRLAKIESFKLDQYKAPKTLSLHRNLIHKLTPLPQNCWNLVTLDVSDNKIKRIPDHLANIKSLTKLDLSYNNIREIAHLEELTNLKELYLQSNKLAKMQGLDKLVQLTILELGCNRFREIEELGTLVNMHELYLGKNKITELNGIHTMTKLRILSVQANRLTDLKNTETLVNVVELYASENGLKGLASLNHMCKLTILDLSSNFFTEVPIDSIRDCTTLEDFWFNDNKIDNWKEVEKLNVFPKLDTVYMRGQPIFTDARYRGRLKELLPTLNVIDSIPVGAQTIHRK